MFKLIVWGYDADGFFQTTRKGLSFKEVSELADKVKVIDGYEGHDIEKE